MNISRRLLSLKKILLKSTASSCKCSTELESSRKANKDTRTSFFETERKWREQEQALMQKKDLVNDLRVRLARVEVREEDLTTLVLEELHRTPDTLPTVSVEVEKEKLEREIAKLKVEVEHVGTLDPLVIEEFTETEQRTQFLAKRIR